MVAPDRPQYIKLGLEERNIFYFEWDQPVLSVYMIISIEKVFET